MAIFSAADSLRATNFEHTSWKDNVTDDNSMSSV